jgi:dihydrofolate reductase
VTLSADTFFPNLDEDPSWHVESVEPGGTTKSGIPYDFITYVRSEQ